VFICLLAIKMLTVNTNYFLISTKTDQLPLSPLNIFKCTIIDTVNNDIYVHSFCTFLLSRYILQLLCIRDCWALNYAVIHKHTHTHTHTHTLAHTYNYADTTVHKWSAFTHLPQVFWINTFCNYKTGRQRSTYPDKLS